MICDSMLTDQSFLSKPIYHCPELFSCKISKIAICGLLYAVVHSVTAFHHTYRSLVRMRLFHDNRHIVHHH